MKHILWDIFFHVDRLTKGDKKRVEKEKAKPNVAKSRKFGIVSIVLLVLGLGLSAVEFLIIPYIIWPIIKYAFSTNLYLIGNLFVIVFAVIIFLVPMYLVAYSRKYAYMQAEVNSLKMGVILRLITLIGVFVALVTMVVSAVATLPYLIAKVNGK